VCGVGFRFDTAVYRFRRFSTTYNNSKAPGVIIPFSRGAGHVCGEINLAPDQRAPCDRSTGTAIPVCV